jgi:hypothetical protein
MGTFNSGAKLSIDLNRPAAGHGFPANTYPGLSCRHRPD